MKQLPLTMVELHEEFRLVLTNHKTEQTLGRVSNQLDGNSVLQPRSHGLFPYLGA